MDDVWRAVVEAHERELMMQRKREGGWLTGRPMPLGPGEIPPQFGGHQPVGPKTMMERLKQATASPLEAEDVMRLATERTHPKAVMDRCRSEIAKAIAQRERTDIEDAIRAYARKLLRERAAIVRSERITRTVHELIRNSGGEPRL